MPVIPVVSDASIKEADKAYLEKHDVQGIMQKLLEKVLKDKPERPVSFLIEHLWRLRDERLVEGVDKTPDE